MKSSIRLALPLAVVSVAFLAFWASSACATLLAITSMTIDTNAGTISINGNALVSGTDFTLTTVSPNSGITYANAQTYQNGPVPDVYSNIAEFTLTSSFLTGYTGISINASPTLATSGGNQPSQDNKNNQPYAKGLALIVPGDININAAWVQNGGSNSGNTTGLGGVGGFAGGAGTAFNDNPGWGPGGGGAGGGLNGTGSGGSLVSHGGLGSNTRGIAYATFPSNFHNQYTVPTVNPSFLDPIQDLIGGSGGGQRDTSGSSGPAGGAGGGAIGFFSDVASGNITITSLGSIQVNGGGGSGGGSGGTIILASGTSGTVTDDGTLQAKGGNGNGGGGGAGGEIAIYYGQTLTGTGTNTETAGSGTGTPSAGAFFSEQTGSNAPPVPEPSTFVLAALGFAALTLVACRRRRGDGRPSACCF